MAEYARRSVMIVLLLMMMMMMNKKEHFNDLCNVPEGQPWLNMQGGRQR